MRYKIKLINTETKQTMMTNWRFSSRKAADEWTAKWRAQGSPFDCEIIDTKKK
jgi:hypothetical protein